MLILFNFQNVINFDKTDSPVLPIQYIRSKLILKWNRRSTTKTQTRWSKSFAAATIQDIGFLPSKDETAKELPSRQLTEVFVIFTVLGEFKERNVTHRLYTY